MKYHYLQVCTAVESVEYSKYITLGERKGGKNENSGEFRRLTKHYFYAIIETSFNCSSII